MTEHQYAEIRVRLDRMEEALNCALEGDNNSVEEGLRVRV